MSGRRMGKAGKILFDIEKALPDQNQVYMLVIRKIIYTWHLSTLQSNRYYVMNGLQ
jgi:hypothetical protein